jgi:predicted RNA-binding Zn-ribbon protein involved in translation (DUF1610 family)
LIVSQNTKSNDFDVSSGKQTKTTELTLQEYVDKFPCPKCGEKRVIDMEGIVCMKCKLLWRQKEDD